MEYESILFETKDTVARITLNRPEKMNAMTGVMFREIHNALDNAEQDENVRWGLIIGSALPQIIGKSAFDDELILGLLLLCLGFIEAGMSFVLSQAMVPAFYLEKK